MRICNKQKTFSWIILALFISFFAKVESEEFISAPLQRLKEGNARYVSSATICHEDWTAKRAALAERQAPYAVIVCCSDSRVPPEVIFDQSLGDLFVVRVAGNVVDDFAIGSVEYGACVLGAKLVVVLGHSKCGAVDAALNRKSFNNHIVDVIKAIRPAVRATRRERENVLEKTIKANIKNVEETLQSSTPTLSTMCKDGSLKIIGGYYQLESGVVEFLP